MAKNKDIDFNGTYISLDWAKEETLQKIEDSSVASAKLLAGILKNIDNSEKTNRLISDSMKKIDSSLTSIDSGQKNKTRLEQRFEELKIKREKKEQERAHKRQKLLSDLNNGLNDGMRDLSRAFKTDIGSIDGAFSSINFVLDSVKSIASSIPIIGILFSSIASGIGFVVGQMQVFSKSIIDLTDSGAAFGVQLINLRKYAGDAAMSMEDFSKLISENTESFRGLGLVGGDYLKLVSEELNSFLEKAGKDFNYFGMSITELNQVLLDEMKIRQKSGQLLGNSQMNLTDSLNELLFQTSAMARLTGQNRREMLTGRNEIMSDSVTTSFLSTLNDDQKNAFSTFVTNFGKLFGNDFTNSIVSSLRTGLPIENFLQDLTGFSQMAYGDSFVNILKGVQNMVMTGANEKDVNSFVLSELTKLSENEEAMKTLRIQADLGNQSAKSLLDQADAIRSISKSDDISKLLAEGKIDEVLELMKKTDAIALPAELQKFSNTLKTSFAMSASDVAGMLGIDYDTLFTKTVETLQKTGDIFRDESGNVISVQEAAKNQINKIIESLDTDDLLFKILESINGMWNWFKTVSPFNGKSATNEEINGFDNIFQKAQTDIDNAKKELSGYNPVLLREAISSIKDRAAKDAKEYLKNNQDIRYEIAGEDFGYTELEQSRKINDYVNSIIPGIIVPEITKSYSVPNENITYKDNEEAEVYIDAMDNIISKINRIYIENTEFSDEIRKAIVDAINAGEPIKPEIVQKISEKTNPNTITEYNDTLSNLNELHSAIKEMTETNRQFAEAVITGNTKLTRALEDMAIS